MKKYKKKSERGQISKDIYDKAAAVLEEDKTKTVRGIAKDFGLCHMTLTRYLKKRSKVKEKGIPMESVTFGYQKNRQVFNNNEETILVNYLTKCSQICYGLTPKYVRQLAFACALKYNITTPQSWHNNKEAGVDWLTAFLKRNPSIINEFKKTGIAPFNKDIFPDEDFLSTFVTDRELDGTASSNIENTPVTTENTPIHSTRTQPPPTQTASLNDTTSPILECTESTFAPEIVRPYPKAAARTKKIIRKTRKSAILTDTPEKDALALEQNKKKENTSKKIKVTKKGMTEPKKVTKQENTNKKGEPAKKKRKIVVKRKMSASVNLNDEKLSITTHVLDTSRGRPADGLPVCLYKFENDKWTLLKESTTDSNGRCGDLLEDERRTCGRFKIEFRVNDYFRRIATTSMYPMIDVMFDVQNPGEHYHIPLLLNPFGFSTYRGS
ncbi:uncharacterized protein [Temnothorax longispinosus]|uniref:uncharacterized protein n=1 Tax=Temnothorax longispinosus TaxID=300112 RepID=UPI003A9974F9